MTDQTELKVDNRQVLGKKVQSLRRQGITPVHVFGQGIESMALQCDTVTLRHTIAKTGKTGLINLKIGNETSPRTVVVREVQTEASTGEILHVDFAQIEMAEELTVDIPVVLIGESPALKSKENTLARELNTLTVKCLPANIPSAIEINITSLTEPDQAIRVNDIDLGEDVTLLNDPELVVVRISSRPAEVTEEPVTAEEAFEAPEAAAETEEEADGE